MRSTGYPCRKSGTGGTRQNLAARTDNADLEPGPGGSRSAGRTGAGQRRTAQDSAGQGTRIRRTAASPGEEERTGGTGGFGGCGGCGGYGRTSGTGTGGPVGRSRRSGARFPRCVHGRALRVMRSGPPAPLAVQSGPGLSSLESEEA
ncbi:hypothetical protein DDW44_01360 [Streptomyces tirandamycinicus]|uniref:Uncharacterized protein n=1 Tax=Streptomyces tirandamycinicus TaxID=2174846 RepID=A0A2S1SME5_9ACTN|nr:hypothetical protein DDW44_01360 [Streptomyces tirandamycinicus]